MTETERVMSLIRSTMPTSCKGSGGRITTGSVLLRGPFRGVVSGKCPSCGSRFGLGPIPSHQGR